MGRTKKRTTYECENCQHQATYIVVRGDSNPQHETHEQLCHQCTWELFGNSVLDIIEITNLFWE